MYMYLFRCVHVHVLTGFSGLSPKSFGFKMAGAKNLKKINPLIDVNRTSSSNSKVGGVN